MARVEGKSPRKVSEQILAKQVDAEHKRANAWLVSSVGFAGGLILLAMWPLATVLAGKETVVDVNVALTATISFAVGGAAAGAYGNQQKKRAGRSEQRARDLSRDVKELQQRLRDHGLPSDVSR